MSPAEFVAKYLKHGHLYHFTDARNLPSIRVHGILSRRELARREVTSVAPGGNQWSWGADDLSGVSDYVHLCFTQNHPMEHIARADGRIQQSKYLWIHPSALEIAGAKITLGVSNKRGVTLQEPEEAFDQMDLEVLYTRMDWKQADIQQRRRATEKYEVLIPKIVVRRLIVGGL